MLKKATRIMRNISLVAMASAIVAIGVMVKDLLQAPIPIDWATPMLEEALQSAGGMTENLNINNLYLIWDPDTRRVEFSADHVRLASAEKTLSAVERVNVTLSIKSLFTGHVRVKDIVLVAPQLHITLPPAGQKPDAGTAPLAGLSPDKNSFLAHLHSITIEHGVIDLTRGDEHDGLNNVELSWQRDGEKSRGIFNGTLRLDSDISPSLIHASLTENDKGTDITASVNDIRPESVQNILDSAAPNLLPANLSLNRLQMPVTFNAALHLDGNGALQTIGGKINAGTGHIIIPELYDAALPIDSLKIMGEYHADTDAWSLSNLHAVLLDEDGTVPMNFQASADAGKKIGLNVNVPNISVAALRRWWPKSVAPGGIAWIDANVSAGAVQHVNVTIGLTPDKGDYALADARGGFDLMNITTKFMPAFPAVEGVNGSAGFVDADHLHLDIKNGHLGDLQVQPGVMDITGLKADNQMMKLDIPVAGQLPDMLRLLDTPPYGYAAKYGLKADQSRGGVGVDVQFEFPMLAALKIQDVKYHAIANVNQVALPGVLMGRNVTNGQGVFEIDPAQMKVTGSAAVAGAPMNFTWQDNFAPVGGVTRSVNFNAELADADHAKLGLPTAGRVQGPAKLSGTYEERGAQKSLQAKMDLANAAVKIDELNFTKPVGAPLIVNASLDMGGVNNLGVTAAGKDIALDGTGVLDGNMQPLKLDFGVLRFGDKNNAKVQFIKNGAQERWAINGDRLDISGLFAPPPDTPEGASAKPKVSETGKPPRWISMKLASLFLANRIELRNVQAEADHDGKHWNKVSLQGSLEGKTPLGAQWQPSQSQGGRQILNVKTDDAGRALAAFGVTNTVRGGHLAITGSGNPGASDWLVSGAITMRDFKIAGAPLLAKLLAVTSPGGILDTLRGDGIGFSTFTTQFQYSDDKLRLTGGKMNGQSIGLTFGGDIRQNDTPSTLDVTGTIVPLYMINTALSGVPILGDILGGSSGLLAFNYHATGKLADPDVGVNPLSALTPGFLRGLLFDNSDERQGTSEKGK